MDENLPPRLARALHALLQPDHKAHAARDMFGPGVSDLEWISELHKSGGWIVISGDRRITKSKNEALAFRQSSIVGFFFSKGLYKANYLKQMERLCALWPFIETQANLVSGGAMFELQMKSTKLSQL